MNSNKFPGSGVIIAMIYPFLGLLYYIKNFRLSSSKYVFIVFCAFYGSILIYQKDTDRFNERADAAHYAKLFTEAHNIRDISFNDYHEQLPAHDKIDYFNPLVIYLLSRITGNPHFYFMIIAIIFGFFYANNLWDVISFCKERFLLVTSIFLMVFILICTFDSISLVRMHTGFQVFFFGMFSYLMTGTKKRLIWVPLSMFFHFSMFFLGAIAIIYFVLKKLGSWVFFTYFLVAHIIDKLDLEIIHRIFSFMPSDINSRLVVYADPQKVELLEKTGKFFLGSSNLWARIDSNILRFFILIMTGILFLPANRYLVKKQEYKELLNFCLFLYGSSLVVANLPSGYRFLIISSMFFFAYFAILFNNFYFIFPNRTRFLLKLAVPFLLVVLFKITRNILDFTTIWVFFGNFFTNFFVETNTSALDSIKEIFGS